MVEGEIDLFKKPFEDSFGILGGFFLQKPTFSVLSIVEAFYLYLGYHI